jgi:K+/H+ antiporter YhaU regulatory subunit KhtT
MAQAILRPAVFELVEAVDERGRPDLQLEEQLVDSGSPLAGKTVGACGLRRSVQGRILVAIKHHDGRLAFDPADDDSLAAGDIIITVRSRLLLGGPDVVAQG